MRGDPYWTTAKFPGRDAAGLPISKGDRIFVYPKRRGQERATVLVGEGAERAAADFEAAAWDEANNSCM